jgi:hypothetical protein
LTNDSNSQHPEGVHLSNAIPNGVEAEAVPVGEAVHGEDPHAPKFDMSEEAIAKARGQADRAQQMAE